ncbi:MAG: glycosyltransferase family 4 protein [Planctomycetes bacterium]|nr:glycosyltransferase family 4 protein [Planctomycetota bacterium]
MFDATSCCKPRRGGIATYGAELVKACVRVAPTHEYVLGVRPQRWTKRALIDDLLPGSPRPRLLVDGLHALLGRPVDVFHGIGVRLPAFAPFAKTVMLHDINVFEFPELSDARWRRTRQARIRQTVARADLVIAYSAQGADALVEHLGLPRGRIRVVPLAVDTERFRRPPDDELAALRARFGLSDRPYVLSVGTYSPRKNQHGLLAAFVAADLPDAWRLVLGGPKSDDAERLRADARRLGLSDERLVLPGYVSDVDMPGLLAGAGVYVCASLHEGFGLPVLEAQACGTPVLSSDRAALLETLGDCGVAFDPHDAESFAQELRRLVDDEPLRADLARRGPERVRREFTWDVLARRTLAVLEEAAGRR